MEKKLWWIRFQTAFGYGTTRGQKLLDRFGRPSAIFGMGDAELRRTGVFREVELERIREATEERARKVLELSARWRCAVITPDDPEYPRRLREIYGCPAVLYVQGTLAGLDDCLTIGMVGTRNSTDYGERAARTIARELAEKGVVVVSGMARGIDTVSHTATLQAGGRTVAVIGCGVDRVYPAENAWLKEEILRSGGAVVTEFPPGTPPLARHFPIRNRIISGLSNGIVVVEGSRHSGSLITAGHALAQNREVFAVPGSIFSETSAGSNLLLRQGAKAVDDVESILEEYQYLIEWAPSEAPEKNFSPAPSFLFEASGKNGYNVGQRPEAAPPPARAGEKPEPRRAAGEKAPARRQTAPPPERLSASQQKVYGVLADGRSRTAEQIAAESGLPLPGVLSSLTQMELFGWVRALSGKRFAIAEGK